MAKLVLNNISSGYQSNTAANTNNDLIETALENTLSRDGTSPNQMEANLDMNSYEVLNVGAPSTDNSAVRLIDLSDSDATGAASAQLRADLLTSGGSSLVGFAQTGVGAIPTTVENKIQLWNDASDFSTIAQALSSSPHLRIPAGTYDLGNTTLSLPQGCTLYGAGSGQVNFTYSGSGIAIDGYGVSDITLRGISITTTNTAATALRLGGAGQHYTLDDVRLYGDTSVNNTGTGLLLESAHVSTAFSGQLSSNMLYTLGYKYGIRYLGDAGNANRTWTTCSFTQTFLLGRGAGVIAGSVGFSVDSLTQLSGASFNGGTVEGFATGLSIATSAFNTNSGIEWNSDIENNTVSYVVGDTFQGTINLNPAAVQYKATANGNDNLWTKEINDSGVMIRESRYQQDSVIYLSGGWNYYTGASKITGGRVGVGTPTLVWSVSTGGNFNTTGTVVSTGTSMYQQSTTGTVKVNSIGKSTSFALQNSKTMTFSPTFGKLFVVTISATGEAGLFWATYASGTITSVGPLPTSIELTSTPSTNAIGIFKSAGANAVSITAGATAATALTSMSICIIGSDQNYALPTDWV